MLTRMKLLRLALWTGVILCPACSGGDPATGPEAPVATVRVSPAALTLVVGRASQLAAVALTDGDTPVSGRTVTWTSTDESAATVSQAGVVTALAEGEATIRATVDGKVGSAVVLVVSPVVESVDLDRTVLQLDEGVRDRLVATPRDAEGHQIAGRVVAWSSSDPGVVEVSFTGEVTALRPGAATITARVHGKTATATITVTADHEYDLLFSGWAGVAGVAPDILTADPRDAGRAAFPVLAAGLKGTNPTASPDGTRIVFAVVDAWARTDLFLLDRTTGVVSRLTDGPEFDDQPSWSPDGTRIAFRRQAMGEAGRIWIVRADRTAPPVRLGGAAPMPSPEASVPLPFSYAYPTWSAGPVGGAPRIAYSRSYAGMSHIWTMAEDGTDQRQVTTGTVYDDQPAWSPDGTTLAFTRYGLTSDIWTVGATGANPQVLVDLPMHQSRPSFSPDGKLVAFLSSTESGHAEIFTVWASGNRRLAQRTADQADKSSVTWVRRP